MAGIHEFNNPQTLSGDRRRNISQPGDATHIARSAVDRHIRQGPNRDHARSRDGSQLP
jgi:hypothetical protein